MPEAYLMQSLWLKVKVSAVDHSRILSDYLSACLLLGGRRIKLTQNLGNITRMLCINNRVKVFLETISDFWFVISYSLVISLVISSIYVIPRGYNGGILKLRDQSVSYFDTYLPYVDNCGHWIDHPPPSTCPHSFWTPQRWFMIENKVFIRNYLSPLCAYVGGISCCVDLSTVSVF